MNLSPSLSPHTHVHMHTSGPIWFGAEVSSLFVRYVFTMSIAVSSIEVPDNVYTITTIVHLGELYRARLLLLAMFG